MIVMTMVMIVMVMENSARPTICHWLCYFTWFLLINTNCNLCVEFNCEHNDKYTAPNQLHVGVVFHQGINAMLCMIGNEVNAPTSSLSTTFQKVLGAARTRHPAQLCESDRRSYKVHWQSPLGSVSNMSLCFSNCICFCICISIFIWRLIRNSFCICICATLLVWSAII